MIAFIGKWLYNYHYVLTKDVLKYACDKFEYFSKEQITDKLTVEKDFIILVCIYLFGTEINFVKCVANNILY